LPAPIPSIHTGLELALELVVILEVVEPARVVDGLDVVIGGLLVVGEMEEAESRLEVVVEDEVAILLVVTGVESRLVLREVVVVEIRVDVKDDEIGRDVVAVTLVVLRPDVILEALLDVKVVTGGLTQLYVIVGVGAL
jgi:hypothetical protein